MTKTYYMDEYTRAQWHALIDKAAELDLPVTYSKYGDRATIDSTALETALIMSNPRAIGTLRQEWAENIHNMIQRAAMSVKH